MKQCPSCKTYKSTDEFSKSKSRSDGLNRICKACDRVKSQSYYQRNKDRINRRAREWARKNPDKVRGSQNKWNKNNKKEWRQDNIEKERAYRRKHYQNNKEQYTIRNKKAHERKRAYVHSLKSAPCTDCGKSYPYYVMDFDHRDPSKKEACISQLIQGNQSWQRLEDELAKCDLVCSNCHRERTHRKSARDGRI